MKLKNHLGLALLAASVIWSGFASAKPAQCFHSVDGKTNIDNRFRFDAAAGSLRFEIAARTFLDRKIIQETRFRA
jgi:hypothetical protein